MQNKTITADANGLINKEKNLTILQRIAERDKTAAQDCVDIYGNLIWTLARKFTASAEEAEAVVQEIFDDIWRSAERLAQSRIAENKLIALIARRRLMKYLPSK